MRKKDEEKSKAIELRKNGVSIKQISKILGVSKSSVSVWVREVVLTDKQEEKLDRVSIERSLINKKEYEKNPKRCKWCNSVLSYSRRHRIFCNNKCGVRELPNCLLCGKKVKYYVSKFCCAECCIEYKWKEKIKKAEETGYVVSVSPEIAKSLLLKMREHKCEICGEIEWMGSKIPLVMDHINGNNKDWRLDNLRLICGNCDRQQPTFGSKNRKNLKKIRGTENV